MYSIVSNYTTRIPKSAIKNVKQLNYSKYPNNNIVDGLENIFHTPLNQVEKKETDISCWLNMWSKHKAEQ